LFENARELGLTSPKIRPSKAKIRKALLELGFYVENAEGEKRLEAG
jgi:hypothetical protein